MPALIHLNGPPGIGKSTLAARYVDDHPGVLNLDIDALHPLVGGWRDPAYDTHEMLRPVALAMAATHLAGGRDVVLPQFIGRIAQLERFEQVAAEQGADFREVILIADRAEAIDRFGRRRDDSAWGVHNRAVVAGMGGEQALGEMYDLLADVLAARPAAVVVPSESGAVEETYAALLRVLGE